MQHDAILTVLTVVDSADDVVTTTVAEFQTLGATAALALPEILFFHLHGLPASVDVAVVGAVLSSEMYHHEPGSLLTWEIMGSQLGALDLGYNLGAHIPTGVEANLLASLLPGRDNVIRGDLSSGVDVEVGIFSIPLISRERHRSFDVELGWGIVVGGMSRDDFNEILSFPICFE